MDVPLIDRREQARFGGPLVAHLSVTLRPGSAATLINLSRGGALVHSSRPLRPGAKVFFQLGGGPRVVQAAAQVLRCSIACIDAATGVTYGGAVRFDTPCDLPWSAVAPCRARIR